MPSSPKPPGSILNTAAEAQQGKALFTAAVVIRKPPRFKTHLNGPGFLLWKRSFSLPC